MAFAEFNKTLMGFRRAPGEYVRGVWVEGERIAITLRTSVQPVSFKDQESLVKRLPEGTRIGSAFNLFTTGDVQQKDIFVISGFEHEVMILDDWDNGIVPHRKAVAVRMQTEGVL